LLQLKWEARFFQLNQLGEAVQQKLDILKSEGKEAYRFMSLQELKSIQLDKPSATSSITLSSVAETHQQKHSSNQGYRHLPICMYNA
jgi:hypothetical protein